MNTLGSGHFGAVEVGIWNHSEGNCDIAVKTLNPSITTPDAKVKFLQEAAIMAQFRHPNVIQLYGIVTDGEPVSLWALCAMHKPLKYMYVLCNTYLYMQVMLILELAHKKDLRTHLSALKPE